MTSEVYWKISSS